MKQSRKEDAGKLFYECYLRESKGSDYFIHPCYPQWDIMYEGQKRVFIKAANNFLKKSNKIV
jgi:hypothetical protein